MAQILDMPQLSDTMKIGVLQKWRKNEGDKMVARRGARRGRDRQGGHGLRGLRRGRAAQAPRSTTAPASRSGRPSRSSARPARTSPSWSRRRRPARGGGAKAAPRREARRRAGAAPPPRRRPRAAAGAGERPAAPPAPPRPGRAPAPAAAARRARRADQGAGLAARPQARRPISASTCAPSRAPAPAAASSSATCKAAARGRRAGRAAAADDGSRGAADAGAARVRRRAPARPARPRSPHRGAPRRRAARRRRRQAAVDDAADDRRAPARVEDDRPALLPDRRRRHGRGDGVPRAGDGRSTAPSCRSTISCSRRARSRCAGCPRPTPRSPRRRSSSTPASTSAWRSRSRTACVTPVIRDADKKTLGQIATEARELAEPRPRAQAAPRGDHRRDVLGLEPGHARHQATSPPSSTRPRAAILAVGTVRKEPVVKDGKIVVGQRMSITLSCDHRVIDGALGAKLLQAIVAILEQPISLAF